MRKSKLRPFFSAMAHSINMQFGPVNTKMNILLTICPHAHAVRTHCEGLETCYLTVFAVIYNFFFSLSLSLLWVTFWFHCLGTSHWWHIQVHIQIERHHHRRIHGEIEIRGTTRSGKALGYGPNVWGNVTSNTKPHSHTHHSLPISSSQA